MAVATADNVTPAHATRNLTLRREEISTLPIIQMLLDAGADPNLKTIDGCTALGNAICHHHEKTVRVLLQAGADAHTRGKRGLPMLHLAALFCNASAAEELISHGADVNSRDTDGNKPLHIAAATIGRSPKPVSMLKGREDVARVLLAAHTDPTIRNNAGQTPLDKAIAAQHQDIIELLPASALR